MTTLKATFLFLLPLVSVVAAVPTPTTDGHLIGDEANVNAGFEPELSLLSTETLKVERRQPTNNPPPRYLPVQPPPPNIPLPAIPGTNSPNPPAYDQIMPPARPDSPGVLPAPGYNNNNQNTITQAKTTKKTKNRKRSTPTIAEIARRQPTSNPPPRYLPVQPPPPTIPLPAIPGTNSPNPPAYDQIMPPARPDSPGVLPAPGYNNNNQNTITQAKTTKKTKNRKRSTPTIAEIARRQPTNNPPPRYLPVQPPPPTIPLPSIPGTNSPNPPAYVWPPARPDSPILPAPGFNNNNQNTNTNTNTQAKKTTNPRKSGGRRHTI